MGHWLDALIKHENAPDANPQKYQKSDLASFDTFETAGFADLQNNPDPGKIMETAPDGTDKTDNIAQMVVWSVLSVPAVGENGIFLATSAAPLKARKARRDNGTLAGCTEQTRKRPCDEPTKPSKLIQSRF